MRGSHVNAKTKYHRIEIYLILLWMLENWHYVEGQEGQGEEEERL